MRGAAACTRATASAMRGLSARTRAAAAGISAISRAMAVSRASAPGISDFVDGGAQIALVPLQQVIGVRAREPESEEDGDLHQAVRLLEIARRVGGGAADDLADHRGGAPAQLGALGLHVHHQAAIDATEA